MIYFARGSQEEALSSADLKSGLFEALDKIGPRRRVIAVPPDMTRLHSRAGELTRLTHRYYGENCRHVLPALGTHSPMSPAQRVTMFGDLPESLFLTHDWRGGVTQLGEVPAAFVKEVSGGLIEYGWPVQVSSYLAEGAYDLMLSIGQVVPHEVVGMANYNKNIFIGTGGPEAINKSHFLGATYGMERMMGRIDTPVRRVLNYASEHFTSDWPLVYVLTVMGLDADGVLKTRGLFVGDDEACFVQAAELSLKVNFTLLDEPLERVVVQLDPDEYKSTWLGNKSIYRTRMAIADGGELIVLAPGLREFGEDREIDRLIRKFGYIGTPGVRDAVARNPELESNLSAAAHLIHGSTEGRFTVTYCPAGLTRREIESVNFRFGDLAALQERYPPDRLRNGFNTLPSGERVFYISNPALGLWAHAARFHEA